jgi:serine/threonine protein phosphatase PrpC
MSTMSIQCFGLSHRGLHREHNEDRFLCDDREGIFLVADGMGGLSRGDVASHIAIETIEAFVKKSRSEGIAWPSIPDSRYSLEEKRFLAGISLANSKIYGEVLKDPSGTPMGTTLTGLLLDGTNVIVANVGDSRIYRINSSGIQQLTHDHSFVMEEVRRGNLTPQQARIHRHKHVIYRALGLSCDVPIDILTIPYGFADLYLLCSDGLSDMLPDEEILSIIRPKQEEPLKDIAEGLIDAANRHGGRDNITAVMVKFIP